MSEEILDNIKELDKRMKEGHNRMVEKIDSIHDHVDEIIQTLGTTEKQMERIKGTLGKTETILQQIKKMNSTIK
ncbi:hypothetical protein FZC83_21580 [Rossellomorea marisflavi]|uniref:Uncharacterized protein n=1 Tax=Rossellomorea marisflavi TaxID=189381 RepID=A0A5D4RA50_9BACI|nr:hypothetical protein [Rossellomorea marisflavi]TYS48265.1 hypothetical protein FZC83_21580 [Rossellomorea marisflavi]